MWDVPPQKHSTAVPSSRPYRLRFTAVRLQSGFFGQTITTPRAPKATPRGLFHGSLNAWTRAIPSGKPPVNYCGPSQTLSPDCAIRLTSRVLVPTMSKMTCGDVQQEQGVSPPQKPNRPTRPHRPIPAVVHLWRGDRTPQVILIKVYSSQESQASSAAGFS